LDIRRDPHILKLIHEKQNPQLHPSSANSAAQPKSGFRALFGSPRKARSGEPQSRSDRSSTPLPPAPPSHTDRETLAKYLSTPSSSTIAKTHVAFKPIARQCEAKVLEIRYPMFAMFKGEPDRAREAGAGVGVAIASGSASGPRKQVAKITLQIFRLPPLSGLKGEALPGCIDDCLRGMRHHAWHEGEYHEGVLTQEGGDCTVCPLLSPYPIVSSSGSGSTLCYPLCLYMLICLSPT
jgi:serine/arginine repetitive matrix protein 2